MTTFLGNQIDFFGLDSAVLEHSDTTSDDPKTSVYNRVKVS